MRYSELFTNKNGIFETIFKVEYPNEYTNIFGDIEPAKLDSFTLFFYGDKNLLDKINEDNANEIVSTVIALNVQGWTREASAMLAQYDIIKPVTGEVERLETVTLQESNDNTETGANKAFNDSDFTDSDRKTKGDERNRAESRQTTETSKGSSKSIPTEIEKELRLRREKWRKKIIFELIKDITKSIY